MSTPPDSTARPPARLVARGARVVSAKTPTSSPASSTTSRLGEMVGMDHSAVSRHECNHVGIGLLTLYRYADALGISVHDLLPPRSGGAS